MKINFFSLSAMAKLIGLSRSAATQTTQVYAGLVAGYPTSLTLTTTDNLAYGMLTYTRSGISIQVVGTLNGTTLTMHEFDVKGQVMSSYVGKRSANDYTGTWLSSSTGRREMPFSFEATSAATVQKPGQLADLTGQYDYKFGPGDGSVTLLVQQLNPGQVAIAMHGIRKESTHCQTVVTRMVLAMAANQARFTAAEFDECAFKLTFFSGGAWVDQADGRATRTISRGVTLTGNYMRSDTTMPVFAAV